MTCTSDIFARKFLPNDTIRKPNVTGHQLNTCKTQSVTGTQSSITMTIIIADDDKGPAWQIDKLYGREEEQDLLNKLSDEKSSSCLLIQGIMGTGKTTLLRSTSWEEKNWVFVEGKYEKDLGTEPYSALIGVMDRLVEIWLENNKAAPMCQVRFVQF